MTFKTDTYVDCNIARNRYTTQKHIIITLIMMEKQCFRESYLDRRGDLSIIELKSQFFSKHHLILPFPVAAYLRQVWRQMCSLTFSESLKSKFHTVGWKNGKILSTVLKSNILKKKILLPQEPFFFSRIFKNVGLLLTLWQ